VTHITTCDLRVVGEQLGTLLLKELTIRIVILVSNFVLFHHVIVKELRRSVDSKASTVGHTHALRHFTLLVEFKFGVCKLNLA
jgi:hypothetical protein